MIGKDFVWSAQISYYKGHYPFLVYDCVLVMCVKAPLKSENPLVPKTYNGEPIGKKWTIKKVEFKPQSIFYIDGKHSDQIQHKFQKMKYKSIPHMIFLLYEHGILARGM
jgi:hypothetical protein